jgi:hypothetical protein
VAADQSKAEENFGFEFETEGLGRVCCRPLNFKLLFKFTDLIKSAPDTVPDFVCSLLSVIGERRDAAVPEDRAISREQAKTLTDQELEQFAARFLEASNWIGPSGKAEPTAEGGEERSYGQRLKRTFGAYEKGLAEQSEPSPQLDGFSDAVSSDSEHGWRLVTGPPIEAEKPVVSDPVKEIYTGFSNGGLEQEHLAVGVAAKFTRVFANIADKWQKQNSRISQHIGESRAALEDKIRAHLKTLRAEANEWATKMVFHRVILGVVIFAAIIDLLSPVFLYLIVRANSRAQGLTAIGNLADTVRSLSQRMDAQTRELAELIKQHDSEQETAAQQTTHLEVNQQKRREKRPHPHSSFSGQHRKARNTHPSPALKLSDKWEPGRGV